jgi:arginine metabolism regulation protein II
MPNENKLHPRVRQVEMDSLFLDTIALATQVHDTTQLQYPRYTELPVLMDNPFLVTDDSLEHTFGITPSIATMIYRTHKIWFYAQGRTCLPDLPEDEVNDSLAKLAEGFETWDPDLETYASVVGDDIKNLALLRSLSTSFYYSARIYFHCCFRFGSSCYDSTPARLSDLTLMALEQSELDRPPASKHGTPLSWPAFVAACEAPPTLRARWTCYWQTLLLHGIGTQQAAWRIVQRVWEKKNNSLSKDTGWGDEDVVLGYFNTFQVIEPSWVSVIRQSGLTIVAL